MPLEVVSRLLGHRSLTMTQVYARVRDQKLRADLDPRHQDRAFDEMVLVGHSMGGLVSRLLTVPGGDDFWGLASSRPLPELGVDGAARQELQQVFYFEELPFVKRVIFLGTPHRGSGGGGAAAEPPRAVQRPGP